MFKHNVLLSRRRLYIPRAFPLLNIPLPIHYEQHEFAKPHPQFDIAEVSSSLFQKQVDTFYNHLEKKEILEAKVDRGSDSITYETITGVTDKISFSLTNGVIEDLIRNNTIVEFKNSPNPVATFILQNWLSLVFLGVIMYSIIMQLTSFSNQKRFFGTSPKTVNPEDVKVKFSDVAGVQNAKLELMEVVEFLKNPEKFTQVGAKIPKGCLLTGGPGLGKTLLAKAVAGEAGVPFFATSASEFVEMFVGVGASRVRDLFKKANESSPCIIFIDEIDAIGKSRTNGAMAANDEREQTINQLLTEMDGFNANTGIIVIAATNRPDILDKALVRPGRFDRQIALDPPTLFDREQILQIHCKGKPLDPSVDLNDLARNTVGLSGADLANITNEAAILAARRNSNTIFPTDFMEAIDRVILGPEKKNTLISEKKKRVVACHEAGHTLVALKVGEYDIITKVSIIPRGKTGGVTMFEPDPENAESGLFSRKYLENRLVVALGGRAAEEIVFGEANTTTGAYNDMEVVQKLARSMIVNYGFSETLGPVSWETGDFSQYTSFKIDKEVTQIVKTAYQKAKNIINNNFTLFNDIAEALYQNEVLSREDLASMTNKSNKYIKNNESRSPIIP